MTAARRELLVVVAGLMAGAALLLWMGRGASPVGDEWSWFGDALHPSADTVLQDYNGHLMALTQAVYSVGARTVGLAPYWPYRVVGVAFHLLLVLLVHRYARPRLGPWWALLPATSLLLLGTAADDELTSINVCVPAAGAAGVVALLALDRGSRRGDAVAALALLVGLACFSNAVAFVAVVVVELVARRAWRRLWVPLVAAVPYLAWRFVQAGGLVGPTPGDGSTGPWDAVLGAARAAGAAVFGLLGVQLGNTGLQDRLPWLDDGAAVLVVLATAALVAWLARSGRLRPRVLGLLAGCGVLWLLLGAGRGAEETMASRYVGQGALLVALLLVEAGRGLSVRSRAVRVAAVVVAGACVLANVRWMDVWADQLRWQSTTARAGAGAFALAGDAADADLVASRDFVLVALPAGRYRQLVAAFGPPATAAPEELAVDSERDRALADGVLARAVGPRLGLGLAPAAPLDPTDVTPVGPWQPTPGGCLALRAGTGGALDLRGPGRGYEVTAGAAAASAVTARRFGDRGVPLGAPQGGTLTARLPRDARGRPWVLHVDGRGPVRVCALARTVG